VKKKILKDVWNSELNTTTAGLQPSIPAANKHQELIGYSEDWAAPDAVQDFRLWNNNWTNHPLNTVAVNVLAELHQFNWPPAPQPVHSIFFETQVSKRIVPRTIQVIHSYGPDAAQKLHKSIYITQYVQHFPMGNAHAFFIATCSC